MKTTVLIDRIKAECPSFGNRVAGSAEFELDLSNDLMALPAAYVMHLFDEPEDNLTAGDVTTQVMNEEFGILIILSNVIDERGQEAANRVDDLRAELWNALLGWVPEDDRGPFVYRGGRHIAMDGARLVHQFNFSSMMVVSSLVEESP